MSWDCYATKSNGKKIKVIYRCPLCGGPLAKPYIEDFKLRSIFEAASNEVVSKTGSVCHLLEKGGMDFKECGELLKMLFNIDPYGPDIPPRIVKKAYKQWAGKDKDLDDKKYLSNTEAETAWFYYETILFMRICAENHLGIHFSW